MKREKYYDGPDGIFYDFKHDEIFTLEHTGIRIYDWKRGKDKGPMYEYRARGQHHTKVAVTGMTNVIRLGDL